MNRRQFFTLLAALPLVPRTPRPAGWTWERRTRRLLVPNPDWAKARQRIVYLQTELHPFLFKP